MQLKQQNISTSDENILPLVNVVFLLLIFFMLAGAFSRPDLFKIELPVAENDNFADRQTLTIIMNDDGELAYNDLIIDLQKLEEFVANEIEINSIEILQLKADANMNAVKLLDVIEILKNTDLDTIHLITLSPQVTQPK